MDKAYWTNDSKSLAHESLCFASSIGKFLVVRLEVTLSDGDVEIRYSSACSGRTCARLPVLAWSTGGPESSERSPICHTPLPLVHERCLTLGLERNSF